MYDFVIIGGGISGLYMATQLHKNHKIILFEKNDYFGGRIYQHEEIIDDKLLSFPCGAGRFNKNHVLLIQLLRKYKLIDFRKTKGFSSSIQFIDSHKEFSKHQSKKNGFTLLYKILDKSKKMDSEQLRQMSFCDLAHEILPSKDVEYLLVSIGYSGQLKYMNAYDACKLFETGIRDDMTYFGGNFHLLVQELVKELQHSRVILKKSCNIEHVVFDNNKQCYEVVYQNKRCLSKKIIFAIPKPSLLRFSILQPISNIIQHSISCKSLCRVYAYFTPENVWFRDLDKKVVTNNPLRYIIPMDADKGLIMISYSDDHYTSFWEKIKHSQEKLKKNIVQYVNKTFDLDISPPEKVWVFDWDCGVGYWNPGVHSENVNSFMVHPLSNVYICGENYSLTQSWVEGALQSCKQCLSLIK
jgi:hypothetical protein